MAGLYLKQFGGFVPRFASHLIQDSEATKAINVRLYSGALRPWRKAKSLPTPVTVAANTVSIYKVKDTAGDDQWFAWTNYVNAVSGPVTDTQAFRMYYTGDGYPRKTNASLAGSSSGGAPADWLSMGVPSPLTAPSVTRVGSGGSPETRVYTYTYVNTFGDIIEESAPAPASAEVLCGSGDSVTVAGFTWSATYSQTGTTVTVSETAHGLTTGMTVYIDFTSGTATDGWYTATVTNSNTYTVTRSTSTSTSGNATVLAKLPAGKYAIGARRIYRSISGSGSTTFNFVAEVALSTTTYSDTLTSAQLGEVITTTDYEPPPNDLQGLVQLPNGILSGFVGRDVYFCVPYYPHAWPSEYVVSVEHDVVGLGVYGQSVVVMTKGNPYIISGVSSDSMSAEKVTINEPCVSKRTIASDAEGVTYVSPNGFIEIGANGVQVITKNLFLKDELALYNITAANSTSSRGVYYMFFRQGTGDTTNGALIFDRNTPATPLTETNLAADTAWTDPETAEIYVVQENEIKQWDSDSVNRLPYEWKSKTFVMPKPVNFGAMDVYADFDDIEDAERLQALLAEIIAYNQALWAISADLESTFNEVTLNIHTFNGSILRDIPTVVDDRYLLIQIYADGVLKQSINVTQRGIYRLIGEYKSDTYEIQANGNVSLRHIKIAETVNELKAL